MKMNTELGYVPVTFNVPVIRDGVVDSCLLILHDWADDLTLDPKEIDSERGDSDHYQKRNGRAD